MENFVTSGELKIVCFTNKVKGKRIASAKMDIKMSHVAFVMISFILQKEVLVKLINMVKGFYVKVNNIVYVQV